ncbi:ribose-5-phosphate isomerase RpiA [Paenibacillus rigui]|uniref:Ribose-5-phosphate isomerase A n=1 Tax=Paenibacillus rigui TaxID=554312 RepID=A0A229UH51_9BACL|nr:ribose-5-phosphate isomerase RpiA [Paenibacillus rigui]OXM82723.1 ribose 5-phosphate isomerase A [Paenibacillus rigui]
MHAKKIAAEKAVEWIQDGMTVGLGTGSTAYWAIQSIAARVKDGLSIRAVASSTSSEDLARELGIPLVPFADVETIDMTIDGADEVDDQLSLIKGGGGALLREKILAASSRRLIIIVDASKRVKQLGRFPLPVEIVPFAANLTLAQIKALGCLPELRLKDGQPFVTDNGNWIADCRFRTIEEPGSLETQLNLIPGVVENGLFVHRASSVIVGYEDGTVQTFTR